LRICLMIIASWLGRGLILTNCWCGQVTDSSWGQSYAPFLITNKGRYWLFVLAVCWAGFLYRRRALTVVYKSPNYPNLQSVTQATFLFHS
jgi:hypothetical protein